MYIKFKKKNIYYEKHGNKNKYIFILPGWGNTKNTFQNMIEFLKADYTIYILDYPSFGNSDTIEEVLTIYDYVSIIEKIINKEKITNPTIIAHSFGGRIASILIGKNKLKIDKLILIDVAGIKRKKTLKVFLKEKIFKLINFLTKNKYKEKLMKIFASSDYKELKKSMRKTFQNIINENLTKYYKEIENETLIIWGEKDKDTPLRDAKKLEKIIKNSALIIYKNRTHYSYLEEPYLTNKVIKILLKKED